MTRHEPQHDHCTRTNIRIHMAARMYFVSKLWNDFHKWCFRNIMHEINFHFMSSLTNWNNVLRSPYQRVFDLLAYEPVDRLCWNSIWEILINLNFIMRVLRECNKFQGTPLKFYVLHFALHHFRCYLCVNISVKTSLHVRTLSWRLQEKRGSKSACVSSFNAR
jgi:hypothetical protein